MWAQWMVLTAVCEGKALHVHWVKYKISCALETLSFGLWG